MVNLGHHPNTEDISKTIENSPGTEQFLKTIKEIRAGVEAALKRTNKVMKRKWDIKKEPDVTISP